MHDGNVADFRRHRELPKCSSTICPWNVHTSLILSNTSYTKWMGSWSKCRITLVYGKTLDPSVLPCKWALGTRLDKVAGKSFFCAAGAFLVFGISVKFCENETSVFFAFRRNEASHDLESLESIQCHWLIVCPWPFYTPIITLFQSNGLFSKLVGSERRTRGHHTMNKRVIHGFKLYMLEAYLASWDGSKEKAFFGHVAHD